MVAAAPILNAAATHTALSLTSLPLPLLPSLPRRTCAAPTTLPAGLILATLTTNIAANVVAPAVAFNAAAPRSLTFTAGGIITAVLGLLTMPWKLYGSFLNFLVAYSVVLGPVVGVVLTDYYVIRGRRLDVDDLFSSSEQGRYWYKVGT